MNLKIYNDNQLLDSQSWVENLRKGAELQRVNGATSDSDEALQKAEEMEGFAVWIEEEIATYQNLRGGKLSLLRAGAEQNFPSLLVDARIARGLSQNQMAEKFGVSLDQWQDWEESNHLDTPAPILRQLEKLLSVRAALILEEISTTAAQNELVAA